MITKSLAGTGRPYVVGQIRATDDNTAHVQINGAPGNRPYGMSLDVQVFGIRVALAGGDFTLGSLADSDKLYTEAQFAARAVGEVNIQVPLRVFVNRAYGFAVAIEDAPFELVDWLNNEVAPSEEEKDDVVEELEEEAPEDYTPRITLRS